MIDRVFGRQVERLERAAYLMFRSIVMFFFVKRRCHSVAWWFRWLGTGTPVLRRRTRIRRETTPRRVSRSCGNLGLCSNLGGLPVNDVGNLVIDMFALLEFINLSIKPGIGCELSSNALSPAIRIRNKVRRRSPIPTGNSSEDYTDGMTPTN